MSRNGTILAVVIVVVMASVSTGFALSYFSTTTSRENTINFNGITLDVQNNSYQSLETPIPVVKPTLDQTPEGLTHISGGCSFSYMLEINCPSNVYLQCWWEWNNPETWAIIESLTLSINVNGTSKYIDFAKNSSSSSAASSSSEFIKSLSTASIPSEPLLLSAGTYSFSVSIQYKEVDLDINASNQSILDLRESTLTFSASTTGSIPGVSNPWYELLTP